MDHRKLLKKNMYFDANFQSYVRLEELHGIIGTHRDKARMVRVARKMLVLNEN